MNIVFLQQKMFTNPIRFRMFEIITVIANDRQGSQISIYEEVKTEKYIKSFIFLYINVL